jgi:hypothetical protein
MVKHEDTVNWETLDELLYNGYLNIFLHKEKKLCIGCFLSFINSMRNAVVEIIENYMDDPTLKSVLLDSFSHLERIPRIH